MPTLRRAPESDNGPKLWDATVACPPLWAISAVQADTLVYGGGKDRTELGEELAWRSHSRNVVEATNDGR